MQILSPSLCRLITTWLDSRYSLLTLQQQVITFQQTIILSFLSRSIARTTKIPRRTHPLKIKSRLATEIGRRIWRPHQPDSYFKQTQGNHFNTFDDTLLFHIIFSEWWKETGRVLAILWLGSDTWGLKWRISVVFIWINSVRANFVSEGQTDCCWLCWPFTKSKYHKDQPLGEHFCKDFSKNGCWTTQFCWPVKQSLSPKF